MHSPVTPSRVTTAQVFAIAGPAMVANLTTPLIGIVSTTAIGRLGDATLLGGVAMASVLFDCMFWLFGFLRMSTVAFTAQSLGAGETSELRAILLRGLSLSFAGNALQILIMSHIERRDLAKMEPLRVVAAAGSWSILPTVGIALFTQVSPWAAYGLTILATAGSAAPYIGLFGTVWGIYHALVQIGMSGQGTLDKVAGPVGEALIMTAAGLAVAIPAVLAYNAFVRSNRVVLAQLDSFAHDLFAFLTTGSHVNDVATVMPIKPLPTARGK